MNNNREKLPFNEGDILFNRVKKTFTYVLKAEFTNKPKINSINFSFMTIGDSSKENIVSNTVSIKRLDGYITRYGNIKDIDMTLEDLKLMDIPKSSIKDRGLRMTKLNREIKMKFLSSY